MINQALGLIEVVSLTAAIEAADVACKSANVELVGYELAKGGGYTTIKVLGDVGAVNAAVAAAATAAARINHVVSIRVIPRPNEQLDRLVLTRDTVGRRVTPPQPSQADVQAPSGVPAAPDTPATPEAPAAPVAPPAVTEPPKPAAAAPRRTTQTGQRTQQRTTNKEGNHHE